MPPNWTLKNGQEGQCYVSVFYFKKKAKNQVGLCFLQAAIMWSFEKRLQYISTIWTIEGHT